MKKLRKLSLKEELEKEAAEIEKELAEDPELDNLKVSKELDDAIYAEIQRYEKEQEENKTGSEKAVRKSRAKRRFIWSPRQKDFRWTPERCILFIRRQGAKGSFQTVFPILCSAGGLCRGSSGAGTEARGWLYSSVRRMRE